MNPPSLCKLSIAAIGMGGEASKKSRLGGGGCLDGDDWLTGLPEELLVEVLTKVLDDTCDIPKVEVCAVHRKFCDSSAFWKRLLATKEWRSR